MSVIIQITLIHSEVYLWSTKTTVNVQLAAQRINKDFFKNIFVLNPGAHNLNDKIIGHPTSIT